MNPRRWLPLASIALGATLAGHTAHAQLLAHPAVVDHLPNGLTVVTVPVDSPGIAAYFTLVRAGSRDEIEHGHSGFAHLFEHMMFRGSLHYTATDYEHRMQQLGADNNAYTTEDYTLFTVTLPSTSLAQLVPIEADRFQHLAYTDAVFQTETRAVLGEYHKNSANPLEPMVEALDELAFTRHTYGHTTMGYLRDIEAMPSEYGYSRRFFQRFYRPDDCTVVVAGDVHHDEVLSLVTQAYGAWGGHRAQVAVPVEREPTAPRSRAIAWEGTSPSRLLVGYRVPGFDVANPDTVALQVVHALAFSESSELYQRLVVREQKALEFGSWAGDFHRDPQLFVIEATLAQGTTFAEVQQAIDDEMARIGRGEASRERIEQVVSHLRYTMPMQLQTAESVAEAVARFAALTGDPGTLEAYHARLSAVTPDDVARVARTYLLPARRTTVTLSEAASAPAGAVHLGPRGASTPAARGPR